MRIRCAYCLFAALTLASMAAPVDAHSRRRHRHPTPPPPPVYSWETGKPDLSPVVIQPYLLPTPAQDPKQADYLRRMNLENGIAVKGEHWIEKGDVRSRDLFILDITQSLEGGFDSVNIYDKGILSWGIMQWAARSGSLDHCLIYIKRRLLATGQKRTWDKFFVANGVDVDSAGLLIYGKRMATPADRRVALRGTMKIGGYDPKLVAYWATVFARAGRQPAVAELQVDYAASIVDAVMNKRLAGVPYHAPGRPGITATDLAGNDPYSEALIFALWTNNPRNAGSYLAQAAAAARSESVSDDPALWSPGAFATALLNACDRSRFGNWPARAALIEARESTVRTGSAADLTPFEQQYRLVLAARKAIRETETANGFGGGTHRAAKTPPSEVAARPIR